MACLWKAAPARAAEERTVTYELERNRRVSMAVYDVDGRLVREVLRGEPQEAGEHSVSWDGLDRYGQPQPPGDYEWRMLLTPGFKAEYITTLGTNTPGTPDDDWIGNHGPLRAVLSDGERIYIGTLSENVPCHIAMTIDGSRVLWRGGIRIAHGGSRGMNVVGSLMYDLRTTGRWDAPRLFAVDPDTGERKVFFDVGLPMGSIRMGAGGGYAFVASKPENRLMWYRVGDHLLEAETIGRTWGVDKIEVEPAGQAQVTEPVDVAVDGQGRACVITQGKIVMLDTDGQQSTLIGRESLINPYRVAWVPERDELLVAERAGSHHVKRFALPGGELMKAYGRAGGRTYGPYDSSSFRNINDVSPDGHGGFVLIEGGREAMQRTARFDAEGRLIDQWFGPQVFFNHAMPDPQNPERVFINGGYNAKTELRVDYETGEWEVVADFHYPRFGDGLFPRGGGAHHQWQVRHRMGHLHLLCDNASRFGIMRLDRENSRFVPVAVGGVAKNPKREPLPEPLASAVEYHEFEVPDRAYQGIPFTWSDANGNGSFEPEEFALGGRGMPGRKVFFDEELNVYGHVFPRDLQEGGRCLLLRNVAKEGENAARWDLREVERLPGQWPEGFGRFHGAGSRGGVYVDGDGAVYRHISSNGRPEHDRPAPGWPTNNTGVNRFMKWGPTGKLAWSVGRQSSVYAHAVAKEWVGRIPGGYFFQPCAILGKTHGCIVMADRVGLPATAWTSDGLYAGYFLDRRAKDGLPEAVYTFWRAAGTSNDGPMPYDMFTGGSMVERNENEVIWFPMGRNESPVYRITGWSGWERRSGIIHLAGRPVAARAEGTGVRGAYFDNPDFEGEPSLVRKDRRLWFTQRPPRRQGEAVDVWREKIVEGIGIADEFSVRWTGRIEAPLSEEYEFYAFNIDNLSATQNDHWVRNQAGVRVYLDGEMILEQWTSGRRGRTRPSSDPIPLEAGRMYDLRIEYANWGEEPTGFSLVWGCFSRELHRVPAGYLYSGE
jgi:hypothetical protein